MTEQRFISIPDRPPCRRTWFNTHVVKKRCQPFDTTHLPTSFLIAFYHWYAKLSPLEDIFFLKIIFIILLLYSLVLSGAWQVNGRPKMWHMASWAAFNVLDDVPLISLSRWSNIISVHFIVGRRWEIDRCDLDSQLTFPLTWLSTNYTLCPCGRWIYCPFTITPRSHSLQRLGQLLYMGFLGSAMKGFH